MSELPAQVSVGVSAYGVLLAGGPALPVKEALDVVEDCDACFVVVDRNPDDWLVRFEKTATSRARDWADNMARVYNRRRAAELARANRARAGRDSFRW